MVNRPLVLNAYWTSQAPQFEGSRSRNRSLSFVLRAFFYGSHPTWGSSRIRAYWAVLYRSSRHLLSLNCRSRRFAQMTCNLRSSVPSAVNTIPAAPVNIRVPPIGNYLQAICRRVPTSHLQPLRNPLQRHHGLVSEPCRNRCPLTVGLAAGPSNRSTQNPAHDWASDKPHEPTSRPS